MRRKFKTVESVKVFLLTLIIQKRKASSKLLRCKGTKDYKAQRTSACKQLKCHSPQGCALTNVIVEIRNDKKYRKCIQRNDFKIQLLVHKSLNGLGHEHISVLLLLYESPRSSGTSLLSPKIKLENQLTVHPSVSSFIMYILYYFFLCLI